jgi:hypothetical protein
MRRASQPPADQARHAALRAAVARRGWVVRRVGGPVPYSYTVGLTGLGLPELVVAGLPAARAAAVLHALADRARRGTADPGAGLGLGTARMLRPEAALPEAAALYGGALRAVRVGVAEGAGHAPWHPAFRRRSRTGTAAAGRVGRPAQATPPDGGSGPPPRPPVSMACQRGVTRPSGRLDRDRRRYVVGPSR